MPETTPLLPPNNSRDVYKRFSPGKKRAIVAVISWAGLNARFAAGAFVSTVPEIAKDLNTTGAVINYVAGIYMIAIAIGMLTWGRYSEFYGRQPIYRTSFPLLCIGALISSLCRNITQLTIGRAIQAFGAASVLSVGAATIGDIYSPEERGIAMNIYLGSTLLGPTLSPLAGGLIGWFLSWRAMQWILFGMSILALISVEVVLPETAHPGSRGIDKFREQESLSGRGRRWKWVWLNPFRSLYLLRGANMSLVTFAGATSQITDYVMLIPMSYTIGSAYGITNPALIGACLLPLGLGNALGVVFLGSISDEITTYVRKRRNGKWIPEDRLLLALPGALLLIPLTVLIYGISIQYIPGKTGMVINLLCLFVNGIGVIAVIGPSGTYVVDILHTRSAEAMAASAGVRSAFAAGTAAVILPAINKFGVAITSGFAAIIGLLGFMAMYFTIIYGSQLRAWKDIGYTIRDTQDELRNEVSLFENDTSV